MAAFLMAGRIRIGGASLATAGGCNDQSCSRRLAVLRRVRLAELCGPGREAGPSFCSVERRQGETKLDFHVIKMIEVPYPFKTL